jgi:spore germination protein YaaH
VEPVTEPSTTPRPTRSTRASRQLLAAVLAFLTVVPATLVPAVPVAAATTVGMGSGTSRIVSDAPIDPTGGPGSTPSDADVSQASDADPGQAPSIQYEQAMEHANDALTFDPGERVTVPFTPRVGDHWPIDAKAPRDLPAGNASGRQLREAPASSIWANGLPPGLANRDVVAADPSADQPSTDPAPTADSGTIAPAAYVITGQPSASTSGAPIGPSGLRREVFGFLPYWEIGDSSTTLDWRTLSTVAYFSVGCLSNGYLDKTTSTGAATTGWAGWTSSKMTSIINAAHQNQTRVVLTISCFAWSGSGASRQAALLGSATARTNLARAAAAAVRDRGADGINLDFEPIVAGYSDEYTALVRQIRSELNKVAPGYQLTFDAMGSIGNQPIADATLPGGADAVFIMGYDYRTDGAAYAGSIDPLTGPKYDLTDTVKAYLAKVPPSKVILGVPYYGRAWSTSSDRLDASTLSGAKYGYSAAPTYGQAIDLVAAYGRRWDNVEQTPWTAYRKQNCTAAYGCVTAWRELYYDDAASLRLRYDLVNRTDLRGAGIWALGFEGTRTELRDALADKFLADKTPPLVGIGTLPQSQRDEGFRVSWSSWDDSTISGYDVQVSTDGGAWTAWLTGTTLMTAIYPGHDGHTYAFRIRAADVHGNVSAWRSIDLGALGTPGGITVGGFATVLVDGLKLRSAPTTADTIMTTLSAGDALQVIGGPVTGEGYTWWQVSGPVKQWAPVDLMQIGGWIAADGNGATNAGPRRPVYATRVDAGITGLQLANGGERVLTPNGDGSQDTLRITWTNQIAFDSLSLRVYRTDGTYVGSQALGGTGAGDHGYSWDGRLGGDLVPNGAYVVQIQGLRGSTVYNAPSASPVSDSQILRFGVIVGPAAPTSVTGIAGPASPTRASSLTWTFTFGGTALRLSASEIARTGTATGCIVAAPVASGTKWLVTVTGCSAGTVIVAVKPGTVVDAVGNWGPAATVTAPTVLIDRTAPTATGPKASLRSQVDVPSTSTTAALSAMLTWTASDPGGAGVRGYDIKRSVDGGSFIAFVTGVTGTSLPVGLTPGHSYRFEVRPTDRAGNVGAWIAGPTFRPALTQQTSSAMTWGGTWTTVNDSRFSGGSARIATAAGARATYSFTGRSIAWVTTFAPNRGIAKVYLDGVLVATIDTGSVTTAYHRVAFAKTWSASGFHTIRIVVAGTAGRPRVDVDAFAVLR